MKGFDYELIDYILSKIRINFPLIIGGGCKNLNDIKNFKKKYSLISCFVGSALHYNKIKKKDLQKLK